MMGAGPVPQPPSVKQANTHIASHLGQRMNEVVEQLKAMARYAFQTTTPGFLVCQGRVRRRQRWPSVIWFIAARAFWPSAQGILA
ncbi:hypothetical protein O1V64_18855 [Rouxiella badensis]|nr:hypothetical protein O1V64_18855 [Rouxiella badensis]